MGCFSKNNTSTLKRNLKRNFKNEEKSLPSRHNHKMTSWVCVFLYMCEYIFIILHMIGKKVTLHNICVDERRKVFKLGSSYIALFTEEYLSIYI